MFDWFNPNPYHLADALVQHWIMLFVAGTLGFIIGYISRNTVAVRLEGDLAGTDRELADCRQATTGPAITPGDDDIIFRRIRERASELDFNHIGVATPAQADDLQAIVGVGPYLERKLHAVGLYTFRQIAGLSKEDVDKVNDIIEFFPGRIERDNWVGQSAELAKHTS